MLTLLGVPHREFEGANADPARARGHVDPADFDAVHHLEEALAGLAAEDVVGAGPVAVEDQFGGVDALVAELVDLAGNGQARQHFAETGRLLDQERGQVAVRLVRALVGAHQHGHQRRTAAVGQPHLLAVDGVGAVGVSRGPGADRRDVGAQFGLGHREGAARLAGRHPRQKSRFCSSVPCWRIM